MTALSMVWPLVATTLLAACGTKTPRRDEPEPEPAGSGAVAAIPVDAAIAIDAGTAPSDPAPPPVDAGAKQLPAIAVDVPTKPAALQTWLVAGHYRQWDAESKTHESDGPHGEAVKTFVSPSLLASLQAGAKQHPKGAAAVKELYDKAGKLSGWAVSVKLSAGDSAAGKRWYWYEAFSTAPTVKPDYEGVGKKLCRECHTDGGSDQILIGFPLL